MKQISRNFLAMAVIGAFYRQEHTGHSGHGAATPGHTTEHAPEHAAIHTPILTPEQEAAAHAKHVEEAKAQLHGEIKAKFNNMVDIRETNFHFRKVTNEVKNADGTTSKIETKRPTVCLPIPVPSVEGIVDILQSGNQKQLDLLLEAVASVVMEQAREFINEHDPVNESNFPFDRMAWDFIANLPKAERRGGGISKEVWEDFAKDYIEVMPAVTGKTKQQVEMAAKVFVMKFAGATTNKPVLKVLQSQLALYAQNTTQGEQFAQCIEFLSNKLDTLLTTDETNLLLAL